MGLYEESPYLRNLLRCLTYARMGPCKPQLTRKQLPCKRGSTLSVAANLADITDPILAGGTLAIELQIDRTAAEWEVYKALKSTKPDKCPRADEIPNRFLLAMGQPLVRALSTLLNRCWAAEYYPKQFRTAHTIVLRKPDAPDAKRDYSTQVPSA